jgi:hypothetical protein
VPLTWPSGRLTVRDAVSRSALLKKFGTLEPPGRFGYTSANPIIKHGPWNRPRSMKVQHPQFPPICPAADTSEETRRTRQILARSYELLRTLPPSDTFLGRQHYPPLPHENEEGRAGAISGANISSLACVALASALPKSPTPPHDPHPTIASSRCAPASDQRRDGAVRARLQSDTRAEHLSRNQLAGMGTRSIPAFDTDTSRIGFLGLARRLRTELRLPATSGEGSNRSKGRYSVSERQVHRKRGRVRE